MLEPLLAVDDIQGHVLPGFGTRFIHLLGVKIKELDAFKFSVAPWLEKVTDAQFANEKRKKRSGYRMKTGKRPDDAYVMLSIALSHVGLLRLGVDTNSLSDRTFKRGMHRDASTLNDLVDANTGRPIGWLFGDEDETTPDILFILGSELADSLHDELQALKQSLSDSAEVILDQLGNRPDDDKEHFGFRDSISQPAIRGRVAEDEFLHRRHISEADLRCNLQARPGQSLIWPGQVVFGYHSQTSRSLQPSSSVREAGVDWMINGSYLVVRRLRQDVKQFNDAMEAAADRLRREYALNISADKLAAMLIGRWKDGTPLISSPLSADASISKDPKLVNNFNFDRVTRPVTLNTGEVLPEVQADPKGITCPHMAHIRKIYPRDGVTAIGAEFTLSKLIVRRGVNFGARFEDDPQETERGLLFMCYQTSIAQQFVFLQKNWANTKHRPTTAGHDMIIGQSGSQENARDGHLIIDGKICPINLKGDWVQMTGGGYFAVPGIRGLKHLLT